MRTTIQQSLSAAISVLCASSAWADGFLRELRIGRAGHAFDHLGNIGEQAETAAASGATIIYGTGLGAAGYQGLPPEDQLAAQRLAVIAYNRKAKQDGIAIAFGYLCATSIVKLDSFDKNWGQKMRDNFRSPPSAWCQIDRHGQRLPSWYGGDYHPACMNHPDWRAYQRYMVRQQLETGHDGIFFDNPTVHPQGCYCEHCMKSFAAFLQKEGRGDRAAGTDVAQDPASIEAIRRLSDEHPKEFLRFRCTIARDFLAAMRGFSRTINPNALVTCNNSLNSQDSLYSQCRTYAYNIAEMSKAEDFVVVEDMSSQPRMAENGQPIEYGPCYKMLHAISRGKPVVAVTLAAGDYHTPPNLVRLAMAEAAAHSASYLSWPTWPESQRRRMIASIRPQTDLLRQCESILNDLRPRADVVLFLPFRRWMETSQCAATALATALSKANVQYEVLSDEAFSLPDSGARRPVFLIESLEVLTADEKAATERFQKSGGRIVVADKPDWLSRVKDAIRLPSITTTGPPTIRFVVCDQPSRTIVHLYNLDAARISSFEDRVRSAADFRVTVRVPFPAVRTVSIRTADAGVPCGPAKFTVHRTDGETFVEVQMPRIGISAIVLVEP